MSTPRGRRGDMVPMLYRKAPDPFIALRNHFDAQTMFAGSVATLEGALATNRPTSASSSSSFGKKLSLRRNKKSLPNHEQNETLGAVRIDAKRASLVAEEVERILARLSSATDSFVEMCRKLCGLSQSLCEDISMIAPFILLDSTVSRHPRLGSLSLHDNTLEVAQGECLLHLHLLRLSSEHNYGVEEAEMRKKRIMQKLNLWVSDKFKDIATNAMPVFWELNQRSHEPLDEKKISEMIPIAMSKLPLLLISMFDNMLLVDCREKVIDELIRYTF